MSNYRFPLSKKPVWSYRDGGRKFGAPRDGGARAHAGVDLIAPPGTPIYAMAPGRVLNVYPFYSGTWALEILQDDGRVARYGEIDQLLPPGIHVGSPVVRGQQIARVSRLQSGSAMLHLEMYAGTGAGPLTVRGPAGGKAQRRGDLIDPTPLLDSAELG